MLHAKFKDYRTMVSEKEDFNCFEPYVSMAVILIM